MAKENKIIPLGTRVLLEPIKEEVKEDDIYTPEDGRKTIAKARVTAIGKDVKLVKVGNVCYFSPVHYDEITEDILVVDEKDIWAIQ